METGENLSEGSAIHRLHRECPPPEELVRRGHWAAGFDPGLGKMTDSESEPKTTLEPAVQSAVQIEPGSEALSVSQPVERLALRPVPELVPRTRGRDPSLRQDWPAL